MKANRNKIIYAMLLIAVVSITFAALSSCVDRSGNGWKSPSYYATATYGAEQFGEQKGAWTQTAEADKFIRELRATEDAGQ